MSCDQRIYHDHLRTRDACDAISTSSLDVSLRDPLSHYWYRPTATCIGRTAIERLRTQDIITIRKRMNMESRLVF